MTSGFCIAPVTNEADLAAIAVLFRAYAASLPVDLDYQDFDAELAALPGKYVPPQGALLLARDDRGASLGCAALRPLAVEGCCEMKRLFLLPDARGLGLGQALTQAVIEQARQRGYTTLQLDTLPTMMKAIILYRQLGFQRIDAYYAPTPPGTVFMALML